MTEQFWDWVSCMLRVLLLMGEVNQETKQYLPKLMSLNEFEFKVWVTQHNLGEKEPSLNRVYQIIIIWDPLDPKGRCVML